MLDSLVTTVGICDAVTAVSRSDDKITLSMHGMGSEEIPFEINNAARAAQLFMRRFKTRGADISVEKRIPIGAGLGGSSADAAGALNALAALYGVNDFSAIEEIADEVGSDTRYMLYGGWARLKGRGNVIHRIESPLKLHFLIIAPHGGVSAAECYRLYDKLPHVYSSGEGAAAAAERGDFGELARSVFNALYLPATEVSPDTRVAVQEARSLSAAAGMTGSGSAAFAVFENQEECLAACKKYNGKFCAYTAETCVPRILYGE